MKNEPAANVTIYESESGLQNTDVGPSHQDEAFSATSSAERQQLERPESSQTSTRDGKHFDRFGEPIPTKLLKKEGGHDGFKETSRNLEVCFIKVSKNKRRTYLMNFVAISISNVHKTKLNSNYLSVLSLSY